MLPGIVFSKNRALQLEACLRSFFMRVQDADHVAVNVIYKATSPLLERQYAEVAREFGDRVNLQPETDFRTQVLQLLKDDIPNHRLGAAADPLEPGQAAKNADRGSGSCVLFLVDDSTFVKPCSVRAACASLDAAPETLGFSLRLGTNITHNYVLDRPQKQPHFDKIREDVLKFKWVGADGDFGYPLELSSSVYRIRDIREMFERLSFSNPNTLESQMSLQAKTYSRRSPYLLCMDRSAAFSIPMNRVQQVFENRASADPGLSIEALADRFERGQRLDVSALDGFEPVSCHQEVHLPFVERRNPDAHA